MSLADEFDAIPVKPSYKYSEAPLTPEEEAKYANAPRVETSGTAKSASLADEFDALKADPKAAEGKDERPGFIDFVKRQPFEAADAFWHHAFNFAHGAAQLIENGLASGAEGIAPGTALAKALRENANQTNQGIADREREYQASIPDSPGSYAGAILGELAPLASGGPGSIGAKVGEAGDALARIPVYLGEKAGTVGKAIGELLGAGTSGAVQGGLFGGLAPVTGEDAPYWQQKLNQIEHGAKLGALIAPFAKAAVAAWNLGSEAVKPLFKNGQEDRVSQFLADNVLDPNAVISKLKNVPEYVPGSRPTTAQAAGDDRLLSLERTLKDAPPYSNMYHDLSKQNNAVRVKALDEVAGDSGKLDFYKAEREAVANDLYSKAIEKGIDPKAYTPFLKGQVTQLVKRPSMQKAMEQAKIDAAEEGIKLGDDTSLQGLHYTKLALDKQITDAQNKGYAHQVRLLMGTKEKLEWVMNKLSPEYAQARATFAEMSKPINQMEQAQKVSGKLDSAPQDTAGVPIMTRAQYQKGLNQVDRAVMDPQQLSVLDNIMADLHRADQTNLAHKPTGSPTAQNLTNLDIVNGLLGKSRALQGAPFIGNAVKLRSESAANNMQKMLAQALINPEIAQAMLLNAQQKALARQLLVGKSATIALPNGVPQAAGYLSNLPNN